MIAAIIIGGIVWVVCGVLAYGVTLGYFWREFPSLQSEDKLRDDRHFAFKYALLGPLGIWACLLRPKHGLMYRNPYRGK